MPNTFDHIIVKDSFQSISYTAKRQKGREDNIPQRDRITHATRLNKQLQAIWSKINEDKANRSAVSLPSKRGAYIEFRSQAGKDLITRSLEDLRKGTRLLNVKYLGDDIQSILATVYVPKGGEASLIKKIRAYQEEETINGNFKNKKLVESIEDISIALVESLWTDKVDLIPSDNKNWCEVWLRTEEIIESVQSENTVLASFRNLLESLSIEYKPNVITFPERAIMLIYVNRQDLQEILERSDSVAEFRLGREAAGFWVNEKNIDQSEWVRDLLSRLCITESNVKVCILDTGVTNGHPLISPFLADDDCLSVDPNWGIRDHASGSGHGTLMAGVVAYGSLEDSLQQRGLVEVSHTLCSVKILPPSGGTNKELWGDITEQAVSRAELQSPTNKTLFCMAVTAYEDDCAGRPSSWSGAIDKLAFGDEDRKRLIIVSGGNIDDQSYWAAYPGSNLLQSVRDPAQSWNALTVGAYTDKVLVTDPTYANHSPVAPAGCLSPFSSTSHMWLRTRWPNKPDVVFEGGNILVSPDGEYVYNYEDYGVLTTSKQFNISRHFDTINATSAATAKASWMAAKLMHKYPEAWPETIRGLIVHSADWSDSMIAQFDTDDSKKNQMKELIRTFGYGKPDIEKALFTTNNSLTYVSEQYIQPFAKRDGGYKTNDMHFYEMPWPKDELLAMQNTPVELQITLSYFIEPGAGEIGWKDKYRYQSHAFKFDLNSPLDTPSEFKKRINAAAREEDDEIIVTDSGSNRWKIGKNGRSNGSIHSDKWTGTAAEIASCNMIAVYPMIGWWRERHNLKRYDSTTRYSLLVSLRTPSTDVDLYSPVMAKIQTPIQIEISTSNGRSEI